MLFRIIVIAIFFVHATGYAADKKQYSLSLTGKSKYPKNFKSFDYTNKNAPKKGDIALGLVGSFDSLNPHILLGNSVSGMSNTYDTLMARSLDELSTSYVLLAEYFIINKSRNIITFKINDNAHWHDGNKITNHDVKFSYEKLKSEGHPYFRISLTDVLNVNLFEDNKISFEVKDITNKDLLVKIGSLPIISKKYYQENKFSKITMEAALTSGPYEILEVRAGKYIVFQRVKNYWAKDLGVNKGRYNFDKIKYVYYRDANIAIQGLKAKEYDFRSENIAKNWANSYPPNLIGKNKLVKIKQDHSIPTGMQCFVLNKRHKFFKDERVREALNLAFDFEWTNKNLFYSSYTRTNSYFSSSPYVAKGKLSNWERNFLAKYLNNEEIEKYKFVDILPVNDGSGNNREYLKKAISLLRDAGWEIKDFKLLNKDGEEFTLEFLITTPSFQRVILPYIRNLKKLGISARIRMVDYSQYQKLLENFDFGVTVTVFSGVNIPGNEQLSFWHSDYANTAGTRNLIGLDNPLIDSLVEKIIDSENYDLKKNYTKLLDRILRNNNYVVPHWNLGSYRIVYWDKFRKPKINPPYGLNIDSWWYNSKADQ